MVDRFFTHFDYFNFPRNETSFLPRRVLVSMYMSPIEKKSNYILFLKSLVNFVSLDIYFSTIREPKETSMRWLERDGVRGGIKYTRELASVHRCAKYLPQSLNDIRTNVTRFCSVESRERVSGKAVSSRFVDSFYVFPELSPTGKYCRKYKRRTHNVEWNKFNLRIRSSLQWFEK